MPLFVYLLYSKSLDCCYIGQTSNLTKRLVAHSAGRVRSTSRGRPWALLGYETYESRSEARWRERQLKLHSDQEIIVYQTVPSDRALMNAWSPTRVVSDPEDANVATRQRL